MLVKAIGKVQLDNGHHTVRAWTAANPANLVESLSGFWAWLVNACRGVSPDNLVYPLPSGLGA